VRKEEKFPVHEPKNPATRVLAKRGSIPESSGKRSEKVISGPLVKNKKNEGKEAINSGTNDRDPH